jgi:hypothetical protein
VRLLELAFDGGVDNLLHVRAAATASETGARCTRHIAGRASALFDEATNLSICNSAAMTNKHWISLVLPENIGSLFLKKMKINVDFKIAGKIHPSEFVLIKSNLYFC